MKTESFKKIIFFLNIVLFCAFMMIFPIAAKYFQSRFFVPESRITQTRKSKKPNFKIGEFVQFSTPNANFQTYKGQAALVNTITKSKNGKSIYYTLTVGNNKKLKKVPEDVLKHPFLIKLKSENSSSLNNEILNKAFKYASKHPGTVLTFPSGKFTIGSSHPDKDYFILPSDTSIVGNQTDLAIENTVYWFGLATGPKATEGVENLTISGINFTAKNPTKGSHFMIMADHGNNWKIFQNSFTMVHQKGSHVFDLGSVQNSRFENNQFIGYAPDLMKSLTFDANKSLHDYYSEAIQFDAAESTGMWDAGLIKAIDPNYESFNKVRYPCQNISVTQNDFLPFVDQYGIIKAYGASIGQHSSDAKEITIANNHFVSSLVSLFQSKDWVMSPVHFSPHSSVKAFNNLFN